MIGGLVGFAGRVRAVGGEVGAAELIDASRACTLIDLTRREEVERALRLCLAWSAVDPEGFARVFDEWFSGSPLDHLRPSELASESLAVAVDADTVPAAGVHQDDSVVIQESGDGAGEEETVEGATSPEGISSPMPAPGEPDVDGHRVDAAGTSPGAPSAASERDARRAHPLVALPQSADDGSLAMAREALQRAVAARAGAAFAERQPNLAAVRSAPLTRAERGQLDRTILRLSRRLDGATSWRRRSASSGSIDLRRTMRHAVTSGGVPRQLQFRGPRRDAARLIVLVDLSLSTRETTRLVLHLLHRLRTSVGSLRAFGFVDSFAPIDRALRTDDPQRAIESILGCVDVDATSDPGRAFRTWWSTWQHLVTADTHVIVLSDGRCNGRDPAYSVIRRLTRRSASTTWISPEPRGAWSLGRGEMATYATCVDRALTVRSVDDLEALVSRRSGSAKRFS